MNELLASAGIILTAAAGFTLIHIYRHPPRWWRRRQARKQREAVFAAMNEATAELSAAFARLGTAIVESLTPAVETFAAAAEKSAQLARDQRLAKAREIREHVDTIHRRYNPDGQINIDHVVMESNMRERAGITGFYPSLDAASYRRHTDPQRSI